MATQPLLAQSTRWPCQSVTSGPVIARARLAGAGAAAPTLTPATGGNNGGIIDVITRGGVGAYLVKFLTRPKNDDGTPTPLPAISLWCQIVDENPTCEGWTVVLDRAVDGGGFTQVQINVFDETNAAADLPTAAWLDVLIWADCGVI